MFQASIKTTWVCELIFDLIFDGGLNTLPIHKSSNIRPADLICFECPADRPSDDAVDFVYAIAEGVVYDFELAPRSFALTHSLVKFRVIRDLSDIVIL